MTRQQIEFSFLNVGHFLDHFFMLIFATVAALALIKDWNTTYAALIVLATPGFIAFGLGALIAGWLADRWSRPGMMVVFFVGIGATSILTSFATSAPMMLAGLLVIGIFAAIYHPVGIAMVIEGRAKTGVPIAVNGIFGNLGVGSAALVTGFLIDSGSWQMAFVVPGVVSIIIGIAYLWFLRQGGGEPVGATAKKHDKSSAAPDAGASFLVKIVAIVLITTALGGLVFQSTTFALPKVLDERLADLASSATLIGWYAFIVFAVAAFAQLVVGWLVDNYSIRTVFVVVAIVQCVFFVAMISMTGIAALLVAIGFMLAVFGQIPINDVLLGRIAKSNWRSRLLALRYVVTFSVQASSLPLIAWIHKNYGFDQLFILLAVVAALIGLAAMLLPQTRAITGHASTPA